MLAEYALFQKILASPRWLFSQPEEDFLEIYRLINHKDEKRTGRLSWYESHQLTTGTAPELNIPQASVDFTTAPLPLRSKRIELRQTINAKAGNYMQLAKQFILSRNGVYFNIKSASECPIGSKIDLTTVDMENQQILNLTGLVTSEVEATTGKNIGIRFIEIDRTQRTFIDRWVNSLNTKNTG
ncbi:MAG: PilZ domain-containing protein [Halobacteriovoraceae bacterium]|nr:PilZ domain-containing protein [Halobacteriovoraceae bacterium]